MQYIAQSLLEDPNCSNVIDLIEIEKALLWSNGKMEFGESSIDLRKYQNEALNDLAEKIKNKINIIWGKTSITIPVIYLTGGGSISLYPYLNKYFKQIKIQENCQYANAIGYLSAQARFLKNS
ncbi:MAG: hypothetical protein ACOCP8_04760, partial [archaeon]